MSPKAWKEYVSTLPEVPPEDARIFHEGIDENLQVEIRARGYTPIDTRFLDGPDQVMGLLRGAARGTINIDQARLQSIKLYADALNMLGKDRTSKDDKPAMQSIEEMLASFSSAVKSPSDNASRANLNPTAPSKQKGVKEQEALDEAVTAAVLEDFFAPEG